MSVEVVLKVKFRKTPYGNEREWFLVSPKKEDIDEATKDEIWEELGVDVDEIPYDKEEG